MDAKLIEKFNKQINNEFYGAYLYFAMSTYFKEIAMEGFSDFMQHKASEKLSLAQKIYDYIILRDEKLSLYKIEEPNIDWINVSDVFSSALSFEENILAETKNLYKSAYEINDFASLEFISKLLDNKTTTTGILRKVVFRIKNTNIIPPAIEELDKFINKMNFI